MPQEPWQTSRPVGSAFQAPLPNYPAIISGAEAAILAEHILQGVEEETQGETNQHGAETNPNFEAEVERRFREAARRQCSEEESEGSQSEMERHGMEANPNSKKGGPSQRKASSKEAEMENIGGTGNQPERPRGTPFSFYLRRPRMKYTARKSVRHPSGIAPPRKVVRCYLCNEENFHAERCPYQHGLAELLCHNCREHGHYYTVFPRPRQDQWTAATTTHPQPPNSTSWQAIT